MIAEVVVSAIDDFLEVFEKGTMTKEVRQLLGILATNWDSTMKAWVSEAAELVRKGTPAEQKAALDELRARTGMTLSELAEKSLKKIVTIQYTKGAAEISAGFNFNQFSMHAADWLVRNDVHWIGNHFDDVSTAITEEAMNVFREGLGREAAGRKFRERLEALVNERKTDTYWEGLATNVIHRSREFGRVEGYTTSGIEKVRISAVIDERTSDVCRYMNGKEIAVKRIVEYRDSMMRTTDPDDVKAKFGWLSPSEIADIESAYTPTEQLPIQLSLPPYHFNCRTRTVAIGLGEDAPVQSKPKPKKKQPKQPPVPKKNKVPNGFVQNPTPSVQTATRPKHNDPEAYSTTFDPNVLNADQRYIYDVLNSRLNVVMPKRFYTDDWKDTGLYPHKLKLEFQRKQGTYYEDYTRTVNLDPVDAAKRFTTEMSLRWVIAHELGHAQHNGNELSRFGYPTPQKYRDIFDAAQKRVAPIVSAPAHGQRFDRNVERNIKRGHIDAKLRSEGYTHGEIQEMAGATFDYFASLSAGRWGYGHMPMYWTRVHSQMAEWHAHLTENTILGNRYFELAFPDEYAATHTDYEKIRKMYK